MRIRQLLLAPTGMRCHASLTVRSGCERLPTAVSLPVVATYSVFVAACATPDVSATISATALITEGFSTHPFCHGLARDVQKRPAVRLLDQSRTAPNEAGPTSLAYLCSAPRTYLGSGRT